MEFAKLDRTDLLNTVQCVSFVNNLDNDAVKLMEIDRSILQHVNTGKRFKHLRISIIPVRARWFYEYKVTPDGFDLLLFIYCWLARESA